MSDEHGENIRATASAIVAKIDYLAEQQLLDAADHIDAQAARLAELEGALRQYADRENWSCSDDEHDHRKGNCCLDVWCLDVWDMNANGYEVAQAALASTATRKDTDG